MSDMNLFQRIGSTLGTALQGTGSGLGGLLSDYSRRQSGMPNLTNQQAMGLLRANAAGTGDAYTQNLIAQQREQQLRDAIRNSPLLTPDQQTLFGSAPPAQMQKLLDEIADRQFGTGSRGSFGTTAQLFKDRQGNVFPGQMSTLGGIRILGTDYNDMQALQDAGFEYVGTSQAYNPENAYAVSFSQQQGEEDASLEADIARYSSEVLAQAQGNFDMMVARPSLVDAADIQRRLERGTAVDAMEIADIRERFEAVGPAFARIRTREAQNELLNTYFDRAAEQANTWTTGMLGGNLAQFRGTPAYDLYNTIQTIKANIGFDKLQDMRDNSPTGGALGQVAIQELERLEAVLGSLDQSQSEEQFKENLKKVQEQVNTSWNLVTDAFERDFGVPYHDTNAADLKSFLLQQARSVGQQPREQITVDY